MLTSLVTTLAIWAWKIITAPFRLAWAIMRPALRFLSAVGILVAVIALVADVTRMQTGAGGPTFMPIASHLQELVPGTLGALREGVSSRLHPWIWDPFLISVLAVPTWAFFALLAACALYAVRDRRAVEIFIN